MFSSTDQLGRIVTLPHLPQRIISLVPSQTELLYTLGLEEEVRGITKFCIHPDPWFRQKVRIGGTKDVHPDRVHSLQPDLIIANKEENDRQQVEELARHYPVWISDIRTLPDALAMIRSIGALTGRVTAAETLARNIEDRFTALTPPGDGTTSLRTAYLIWRRPWMAAGGDTFIQEMLRYNGLINAFRHLDRYPVIEPDTLARSGCQCVLLSSEPYPFREQHIREIREILPDARVLLVDGEMFSWYGSRLLEAPAYFRQLAGRLRITT